MPQLAAVLNETLPTGLLACEWLALPAPSRAVARREAAMTRRHGLMWFLYAELRRAAVQAITPIALRVRDATPTKITLRPEHGRGRVDDDRRLPARGPPDEMTP